MIPDIKEDVMEFTEVIRDRYSCKKYDGRQITKEQIEAILEAGRVAPTAKNLQEQHIYVVQSEEGLAKIDKVTPCRYGAKTVLVVAFDRENVFTYPGGNRDSGIEDAAIVATHLMLGAKNVGVDSCWLEEILMLLDLGYAAEGSGPLPNHGKRKELAETVSYI